MLRFLHLACVSVFLFLNEFSPSRIGMGVGIGVVSWTAITLPRYTRDNPLCLHIPAVCQALISLCNCSAYPGFSNFLRRAFHFRLATSPSEFIGWPCGWALLLWLLTIAGVRLRRFAGDHLSPRLVVPFSCFNLKPRLPSDLKLLHGMSK